VYSIPKQDPIPGFPIPIVIALFSVAIIILIAIMIWIFSCYCQKQEPNTRTNEPSYRSPSKHSRSSLPLEQNTAYNQVLTNKYHNVPSNDRRASSPFYSELITSDKLGSNVYQLYTNPADIKPNHYQSHKPYGYLC
jgi:cytoskeletal protein RodZ